MEKSLARLIKKRAQIKSEVKKVINNTIKIQKIIKDYDEQLYTNKICKLEETYILRKV